MAVADPPVGRAYDEERADPDSFLLDHLAKEMARARMLSDRAYDRATGEYSTPGDISRWQEAASAYRAAVDAYKRELDRVEARDRDLSGPRFLARAQQWQAKLERAYGGKGEQYKALCATLAPLIVRGEAANAGQMRLGPQEHTDLVRTIVSVIAQLQKHTESTHTTSENISKGAMLVLQVVERRLGNQPRLLREIYQDSREAVAQESVIEAKALPPGEPG